jgi:hypothetical protein
MLKSNDGVIGWRGFLGYTWYACMIARILRLKIRSPLDDCTVWYEDITYNIE